MEGPGFQPQFWKNLLRFGGFVHAGSGILPDSDYGGAAWLDVSKEVEHVVGPAGSFPGLGALSPVIWMQWTKQKRCPA